jgi:polyisoprenoid-binding protein YceI
MLMSNASFGCDGELLKVDPAASTASFTVKQGDAPFSSEFRRFGGTVCLDENANISVIDVWLDPASVDTGLPEVDALLRAEEFFRTTEFPRVTFTSVAVEHDGERARVSGPLEINGISRTYDVIFRFEPLSARQWKASGSFTVLRLEHDLGRGEWDNTDYLDNDVEVAFDAILVPADERTE